MWANELAQRCDCEEEQCHSPENMKIPGELIIIYYMSHIYIISMIRNFFSGYMALAENVFTHQKQSMLLMLGKNLLDITEM